MIGHFLQLYLVCGVLMEDIQLQPPAVRQSGSQRAESREQRAESREQRAESREEGGGRREERGERETLWRHSYIHMVRDKGRG